MLQSCCYRTDVLVATRFFMYIKFKRRISVEEKLGTQLGGMVVEILVTARY